MNNKPIFILGAHKSGTSLLRSIFDGHSKLYAIPIESHYFQLKRYWVDNEYRRNIPKKLNPEEIISKFTNWIIKNNNLENKYVDSISKAVFKLLNFI